MNVHLPLAEVKGKWPDWLRVYIVLMDASVAFCALVPHVLTEHIQMNCMNLAIFGIGVNSRIDI